jgi:hypothetical protein
MKRSILFFFDERDEREPERNNINAANVPARYVKLPSHYFSVELTYEITNTVIIPSHV